MQNLVVVSRTVCEHVGGPKILETLGPPSLLMWAWLTPRNTILPTCVSTGNFVALCHQTSVVMEMRQKNLTPRVPLSRSLEVIGTDTDRSATYDFLSVIRGNHGPIS